MGRCEADDVSPIDSLLDRPAVLTRKHLSRSVEGDVGVSVQADEVFVAGVLHGYSSFTVVRIPSRGHSQHRLARATSCRGTS